MKSFLKKFPLLIFIISLLIIFLFVGLGDRVAVPLFPDHQSLVAGILRIIGFGVMIPLLMCISGQKSLGFRKGDVGMMIVKCLPILIPTALLTISAIVGTCLGKHAENRPVSQLIEIAVLCIAVGLFEEIGFRAIMNDALVYQFRSYPKIFTVSAWAGSLLFGFVHVMGTFGVAFGDTVSTLTFFAKIIETGLFGLIMLILFWKTRNIWACAAVHALNDFLPLCTSFLAGSGTLDSIRYVSDGQTGIYSLVVYTVLILLSIIVLLRFRKTILPTLDFEKMRQEW